MRIQIYDEEITGETQLIEKTASDTGLTFLGLRLFLASSDVLHNEPNDDDRSAITFWFEKGNVEQWKKVTSTLTKLTELGL